MSNIEFTKGLFGSLEVLIDGKGFPIPFTDRDEKPNKVVYGGLVYLANVHIYPGSLNDVQIPGSRYLSFDADGKSNTGVHWLTFKFPNGLTIYAVYNRLRNILFTSEVVETVRIFKEIAVMVYHNRRQVKHGYSTKAFIPLAPVQENIPDREIDDYFRKHPIDLRSFFNLSPEMDLQSDMEQISG